MPEKLFPMTKLLFQYYVNVINLLPCSLYCIPNNVQWLRELFSVAPTKNAVRLTYKIVYEWRHRSIESLYPEYSKVVSCYGNNTVLTFNYGNFRGYHSLLPLSNAKIQQTLILCLWLPFPSCTNANEHHRCHIPPQIQPKQRNCGSLF